MASNRLAHVLRKSQAMGPSVRNLINQYNLDPGQIKSSGPHQTILKCDVLNHINQRANPKATTNLAAAEMRAHAKLSGAKPPTAMNTGSNSDSQKAYNTSYISNLARSKYARRKLDPLEIDVINSGGLIEVQDASKHAAQKKR